jgi:LPXTG-motif cell wall-anchored protein
MIKGRLTKILAVLVFVVSLSAVNLAPLHVEAAADTCTWTGTTSVNWATGTNWSGCDNGGVPENGDTLVFPESGSNKVTNNNISSLSVATITITGQNYTIAGNAFTITGVTAITANQSATISANVTYNSGSHVNFYPASGAALLLTGSSAFSLSSFYEVNVGAPSYSGTVDFTGNITGTIASQFVVQNGAIGIVRGSTNTYTVGTVGAESDGVFECRSATCFGDNANDIYTGGGHVRLYSSSVYSNDIQGSSVTSYDSWLEAYEDVSITGAMTVIDPLNIAQYVANKSLQFNGAGTLGGEVDVYGNNTSSNIKFDGALSGAGDITVHSGNAWMSSSNTNTGTITVNSGAVVMADQTNSLGATSAPTVIESGGTLNLNSASSIALAEPIQVAGTGVSPVSYKGAIYNADGNFALTGTITLTDDALIYNEGTGSTLSINGVISGAHNLTYHAVDNAYNQASGSSANIYTGTTTVSGGILYLGKTLAVPGSLVIDATNPSTNEATVYTYATNAIADSATVTLANSTDQLRVGESGVTEVIGGLSGADGLVSFQYSDSDLRINQNFDSTYGGDFYADGEGPTITKSGTGNLILTGGMQWDLDDDVNFVVSEGTLTVDGNLQTAAGTDLTVQGTGTLKGTGTVGNLLTNGGKIAPGNSPGRLDVTTLTLNSSTVFEQEIAGNVAGTSYDQVVASGAVSLGDATLNVIPSYTPSTGQVFTIITGSSVSGNFNGLANNSTVVINGITFRVNYNATNVTLTYVSGTLGELADTGTDASIIMAFAGLLTIAGVGLGLRKRLGLKS